MGRARVKEEVEAAKKRAEEAEVKAKKFENRYRQALKEAEEVRE